jgi:hypothetical protein
MIQRFLGDLLNAGWLSKLGKKISKIVYFFLGFRVMVSGVRLKCEWTQALNSKPSLVSCLSREGFKNCGDPSHWRPTSFPLLWCERHLLKKNWRISRDVLKDWIHIILLMGTYHLLGLQHHCWTGSSQNMF